MHRNTVFIWSELKNIVAIVQTFPYSNLTCKTADLFTFTKKSLMVNLLFCSVDFSGLVYQATCVTNLISQVYKSYMYIQMG